MYTSMFMAQNSHSSLAGVNHPLFSTSRNSGSSDGIARTPELLEEMLKQITKNQYRMSAPAASNGHLF